MTSDNTRLLTSLLARLDADAATDRPLFRGVVSDDERTALRSLLQDSERPAVPSSVEPSDKPAEEPITPTHTPTVQLNTSALAFKKTPDPRWILCLDFGTAKSKAFAATDEDEPELEPLPIGQADNDLDDSVHEISSSVWIDDHGLLFMGSEAIKRGMNYSDSSTRHRLDSLKQYISQVDPQHEPEKLHEKLPREVDPTSKLTYFDVITFYLAYLTDLATTALEPRSSTRYVRRRFTVPWWTLEQRKWAGALLSKALVRAQLLADTFHGKWRNGIRVEDIKSAVGDTAEHDGQLEWMLATESNSGILEALAAASARVWHDRLARDVMLVVDVGAGTTDLSLFWVVQEGGELRRAWPIAPCGTAVRQAGDTLDSLLVAELLRKAELGEDMTLKQRVSDSLRRGRVRLLKETLFDRGEVTAILVNDDTVRLTREEFMNSAGIKRFENKIADEIRKLLAMVDPTWEAAVANHITLVLTGGGCRLPMIRDLQHKEWTLGNRSIICRLAPDVPDFVAQRFSAEFIREYPKLAVAMGGALKMRLDEKDAMTDWMGGAPKPGQLEKFQARGI